MDIKLLSGALGAEIDGLDLKNSSEENFKVINNLLLEHKVIFFRNQKITPEEQLALAKRFGPLETHAYVKGRDKYPEIVRIIKDPNEKKQGSKKKLVTMTIDTDDVDVTNDEAILKDKKCVGYITSGGYAHHVKKSMALGYVPPELSKRNSTLDVEINGKLYLAHVTDKPLYDANGGKMKS